MNASSRGRYVIAGGVALAVAAGAYAAGHAASKSTHDTTPAAARAQVVGPQGAQAQSPQVPGPQGGQYRQGVPGGFGYGKSATGPAAAKARAAALAKFPGQVERVDQLSDGSYVVHVFTDLGEIHVAVSKDFKVTGSDAGRYRGGLGGGSAPAPAPDAPTTQN